MVERPAIFRIWIWKCNYACQHDPNPQFFCSTCCRCWRNTRMGGRKSTIKPSDSDSGERLDEKVNCSYGALVVSAGYTQTLHVEVKNKTAIGIVYYIAYVDKKGDMQQTLIKVAAKGKGVLK